MQASSEGERCRADETNRKGKGKVTEDKVNMKAEEGEREEEQVRMAPNMGARGSHPQAMSDLGVEDMAEGEQQRNEEKEEILKLLRGWQEKETSPIVRWAWADESTETESRQEDKREMEGRKGEMGARDNGEKRKQHLTRCLSLSNHSNNSNNTSSSSNSSSNNGSGSRGDAASVTST